MSELSSVTIRSNNHEPTSQPYEQDRLHRKVNQLADQISDMECLHPEALHPGALAQAREAVFSLEREAQSTVHFSSDVSMQQFMLDTTQFDGMHSRLDALEALLISSTLETAPSSGSSKSAQQAQTNSANWSCV